MNVTGAWIVAAALLAALAFGGYRRLTDGRALAVPASGTLRLDAASLGASLGARATFVQFSSTACSPCTATRRLLAQVSAEQGAVHHIDIDAETRLDLVEQLGVTRTPTVLLLDREGLVRHRITGGARRAEVLEALSHVTNQADAHP